MATNPAVPFHDEGNSFTVQNNTGATILGKRFVAVNATGTFDDVALVGLPTVGGPVLGVTAYDIAAGAQGTCYSAPGVVMPVTTGTAVVAGSEVQVDATGAVVPLTTGKRAGYALKDSAVGADAKIKLGS